MRVSDFHFDLPEELIAQHPPAERGSSRMLVMDRRSGELTDAMFADLPQWLRPGDLLVLNDSRVLPARLFATRAGLTTQANSPQPSGAIEVLLTEEVAAAGDSFENKENAGILPLRHAQGQNDRSVVWRALVKPAKKVRVGETLHFHGADGELVLTAEVAEAGEFGERTLRFAAAKDFYERVTRIGHMPLPPYIRREQASEPDTVEDRERYQTVYAERVGSAAAPTAGLHFTPEILAAVRARGVEIAYVTLHVGLGTFQPVRVSELKDIRLHAERYTLSAATAEALNRALAEGGRVIAVGTTTTRTLEHIAAEAEELVTWAKAPGIAGAVLPGLKSRPISEAFAGKFTAHSGSTSVFLAPGHRFRVVTGLLTNFHLPESTLLMLVSALAVEAGDADEGRRAVLAAYAHAVRGRYRFYSYGDCMLLL